MITTGLMGTGKTTLAKSVARKTGDVMISSDVVRKQLAGIPQTERKYDGFQSGIYSLEFTRKTYDTMFGMAFRLLANGQNVIIDASFKKRDERLTARQMAAKADADFVMIECVLNDEEIKRRLVKRSASGTSVSDGRLEILGEQKADFDRIGELESSNHIVIDTTHLADESADFVIERAWQ
jgi:predicted kinase